MNLCIFSGNLTRDPEMRYTPQGTAVTEFSVAVNEGSGEKRSTAYIRCIAWERLAETVAEHKRKGHKVLVTGSYESESWVDKNGTKRESIRIRCRNVEFLDRPEASQATLPLEAFDDPIPF